MRAPCVVLYDNSWPDPLTLDNTKRFTEERDQPGEMEWVEIVDFRDICLRVLPKRQSGQAPNVRRLTQRPS